MGCQVLREKRVPRAKKFGKCFQGHVQKAMKQLTVKTKHTLLAPQPFTGSQEVLLEHGANNGETVAGAYLPGND